jgi:hypothetical protein
MPKHRVTVEFQQTSHSHWDVDAADAMAAQEAAEQALVDGLLDAPGCREIERKAGEIELVCSDAEQIEDEPADTLHAMEPPPKGEGSLLF